MRIKTKAGDLPFMRFTFPDGQRHFELQMGSDFHEATIETRIANAEELMDVLLAQDVLRNMGYAVSLDIRYLLAARMDRRIGTGHPYTLGVVARALRSAGFARIRVLDPHSRMALDELGATAVLPFGPVANVLSHYLASETVIVAPDAGATDRVRNLLAGAADRPFRVVQGLKHRDPHTGTLSHFSVEDTSVVCGHTCLIVDDLCDGGGTFTGLAAVLRAARAEAVDLFVTHGIFSKGLPLDGIRNVYTTDSYGNPLSMAAGAIVLKVNMDTVDQLLKERAYAR